MSTLRGAPVGFQSATARVTSRVTSSPSPIMKASTKSARGSGLKAQGPPATTTGSSRPRSAACRLTRPSFSMARMLE